jgi:hypothetical protein
MKRIVLYNFLMDLIEEWSRMRQEEPWEEYPSASEVTHSLWGTEDICGWSIFSLDDDSNSFTIVEVIKMAVYDYYGDAYWTEMEDYLNRLSEEERSDMDLREFTEIFYWVIRDCGTPE